VTYHSHIGKGSCSVFRLPLLLGHGKLVGNAIETLVQLLQSRQAREMGPVFIMMAFLSLGEGTTGSITGFHLLLISEHLT
jgi:hypothetical protein